LYINDGKGNFTNESFRLPSSPSSKYFAIALDVDGDGDEDLLNAPGGSDFQLMINDGKGYFSDGAAFVDTIGSVWHWNGAGQMVAVDIDNDDDMDFVLAAEQQTRTVFNLSRQLAWRAIPRVGKSLTMDLYGPTNGQYLLAASRLTTSIPMPPYGILRIFPSTIIYQSNGNLDNNGRSSVSFNVPSTPALVGVSLYWQAVVGPMARLSNLEITTFTDL
jgi:hypothetical protein